MPECQVPGAIGVDFNNRTAADIIHNLNSFPYPFNDSSFNQIYLDNAIEHLDDVMHVMEEVYRILKRGGIAKVIAPYFRSPRAYIDSTHRHFFTVSSFAYFDPDHIIWTLYDYSLARFRLDKVVFNEALRNHWIKKIVLSLANRWPW